MPKCESCKKIDYKQYYAKIDKDFVCWRKLGGISKAKSIINLTNRLKIEVNAVLDIGCGLGDVTKELINQNYAKSYVLGEISSTAIDYLLSKFKSNNNCAVRLLEKNFWETKDRYTMAILSHVLEHVEKPKELLAKALKIADYVYVEVPLENCLISNFLAKLQEIVIGKKRIENPTGHIHFFNKKMMLDLVNTVEGKVIEGQTYFPEYRFHIFGKSNLIKPFFGIKFLIFLALYKLFRTRVVSTHFAFIATTPA